MGGGESIAKGLEGAERKGQQADADIELARREAVDEEDPDEDAGDDAWEKEFEISEFPLAPVVAEGEEVAGTEQRQQ